MILLEVDDFLIASDSPESRKWLRETLEGRFRLGKYRDCHAGPVEYAGRSVRMGPQRTTIDQEKYILEELRPIALARGRLGQKKLPLDREEFKSL
eukprot:5064519-Pyramimonas_sp.AAC.1